MSWLGSPCADLCGTFCAPGDGAGPCTLAEVVSRPFADVSATVASVVQALTPSPGFRQEHAREHGPVIVAFEGHRVPNFVRYGSVLLQCTLYRRQINICYACGRLGHHADVCSHPGDVICRCCGAPHPDQEHQRTPKCKLCGGAHLTADKACKERYHIPYVVRRQRRERARLTRDDDDCATASNAAADDSGRFGNRFRSRSGDRSGNRSMRGLRSRNRHRACSRGAPRGAPTGSASRGYSRSPSGSRSGSRPGTTGVPRQRSASHPAPSSASNVNKNKRGTLIWADIVRGRGNATSQVGSGSLPEHVTHTTSEIAFLKRENAMMKEMIHKLTATIAELKNDRSVGAATPATDNIANADTPRRS
ncbi:hypothetical protein HPB49_016185 [Dermacentor silvarum]|uniref:Uncharacterized protein n=1 Tax=Dermacentor silvarum TaxID=543639 RepID=A0ACB8E183_DERSI|nr:hypothetical protein HPB49_016185 [Dermacentor silvarum]